MPAHINLYPPAYSDTYVKATSTLSKNYYPWYAVNPISSLTGSSVITSWLASSTAVPQKFNIDLGSAYQINNMYFSNYHNNGSVTEAGVKTLRIYGTNSSTAFNNTDGLDTTDLTLLAEVVVAQHVSEDVSDIQLIELSSSTDTYRYVSVIIVDTYVTSVTYMGFRNITFTSTYSNLEIAPIYEREFVRAYIQPKLVYEKPGTDSQIVYNIWYNKNIKSKYTNDFIVNTMSTTFDSAYCVYTTNWERITRPVYTYDENSLFNYTEGYIAGSVTVSGVVWPNVTVRLYYSVNGLMISSTKSDDTGYFRFNMLEYNKDYYTVLAYKDGFNAIVYDGVKASRA